MLDIFKSDWLYSISVTALDFIFTDRISPKLQLGIKVTPDIVDTGKGQKMKKS